MFIVSKKTNVLITAGRFFYPGTNFIPEEEKERVTSDAMVKEQIEEGYFTIREEARVPKKSSKDVKSFQEEIAGVPAKTALDIIRQTYTRDELSAIIDNDSRKSVVSAAEKQLEKLTEDNED